MNQIIFNPADGKSFSLNVVEGMAADELEMFLQTVCEPGLSFQDQQELGDGLEAIVPALVELRDAGHIKLNMRVIVDYATLDGFMQLADDERLSILTRQRCGAIRTRMVVQGVKSLLGHN